MSSRILFFDIPESTINKNREFCIEYKNIYILHPRGEDCNLEVFHNHKKVIGGIDKHTQMIGDHRLLYDNNIVNSNESYDVLVDEPSFLLQDPAGLNYIHFFFCFFGKCHYYDELIKQTNIKLYIPAELYHNTGRATFIKEWMQLYYPNINIYVIDHDKRYKFKNLIVPNSFYNFTQPFGYNIIYKMMRKVIDNIPINENYLNKSVYISRQDTIKRGWYHNRILINELDLIDGFKRNNYDIIELMDFNMAQKIQIFKSYKTIVQQSSASVIGILFSSKHTTHYLIEHPKMNWWLTPKCKEFASLSKSNLVTIEDFGEIISSEKQTDDNNYPWKINEIEYMIENIKNTI